MCHADLLRWPGPELKPPPCDNGLKCKPASGFGIKGWTLWAGKGTCIKDNK